MSQRTPGPAFPTRSQKATLNEIDEVCETTQQSLGVRQLASLSRIVGPPVSPVTLVRRLCNITLAYGRYSSISVGRTDAGTGSADDACRGINKSRCRTGHHFVPVHPVKGRQISIPTQLLQFSREGGNSQT